MTSNKVICREPELDKIKTRLDSDATEFTVVYGRRRVGKTWLVRNSIPQLLKKKDYIYLEITGTIGDDLHTLSTKESLYNSLNLSWSICFGETLFDPLSDSGNINVENLFFLKLAEKSHSLRNRKLIVFFDELPWIAKTSKIFFDGILFFRNNVARDNPNIKIFVSGSSTSWMLDNIVNAKGSAALRATEIIKLSPFSLADTQRYLAEKCKMTCSNEIVVDIFLCIGGIPYYLDYMNARKSWVENIHTLTSVEDGLLSRETEHDKVFSILFKNPQFHKKIVDHIATSRYGRTSMEISEEIISQNKPNGKLSRALRELVSCDILEKREQLFNKHKQSKYLIKDNYLNFYYKWLKEKKQINFSAFSDIINSQAYHSWRGFMFELILYSHHFNIMKKLGYDQLAYETYLYHYEKRNSKKQIDLLLVLPRLKMLIICEAKYRDRFELSKTEVEAMRKKRKDIKEYSKHHRKSFEIKCCYITKNSLAKNEAYQSLLPLEIVLDDLF